MKTDRILLARTDRLGDTVLSTPAVKALKTAFPNCHLAVLVTRYTEPVFDGNPFVDDVLSYDPRGVHGGFSGFRRLVGMVKSHSFDVAILLFPSPRVSAACWCARVPVRIGTGFRAWSFLYNRPVYVHRSACRKHEASYNLDLLRGLGVVGDDPAPAVFVSEAERRKMSDVLRGLGVREGERLIVVHPGSGQSALVWPPHRFNGLLKQIVSRTLGHVVLVGVAEETQLTSSVKQGVSEKVTDLTGKTDLRSLMALLSLADVFVGNSSGPMHVAAALSTPVVAIFSPVKSHGPVRWGPIGNHHTVLVPRLDRTPFPSQGGKLHPMELIAVEEVVEAIERTLEKRR